MAKCNYQLISFWYFFILLFGWLGWFDYFVGFFPPIIHWRLLWQGKPGRVKGDAQHRGVGAGGAPAAAPAGAVGSLLPSRCWYRHPWPVQALAVMWVPDAHWKWGLEALFSPKSILIFNLFWSLEMNWVTDQRRAEQAAFRGAWQIATSVCCEAEQCDMGLLLIKYICSVFTFARDSQVLETLSFSVFGFSYLNYF